MDDRPPATPAIWLLILTNTVIFALMASAEGDVNLSPTLIADWGGVLPLQWMHGEFWRLLTAGFLHFSPMHLVANMICLLVWGVPIERGIGTIRFLLLYLASIVSGAIGTMTLHGGIFVGAGASGGTSGLLGALLAFTWMGRVRLPASYFLINIGLNVGITILMPSIDWKAHLFGFLAGLVLAPILTPRRS